MLRFWFPFRHFLKRAAGNIITKYSRPLLKSDLVTRRLTFWGRLILRPFTVGTYHRKWQSNYGGGIHRKYSLPFASHCNRLVTDRIKDMFLTNVRYNRILTSVEFPNRVQDYDIGCNIACGCHAAVYEARTQKLNYSSGLRCDNAYRLLAGDSSSFFSSEELRNDPLLQYPLAIKIMFNYQFDAPERYLWTDMGNELLPISAEQNVLSGSMASVAHLSRPHPNIVKMYTAFTDRMPVLEDAHRLYPEALPTANYYELVIEEPKTLFVIMKRYRMTLREYVLTSKRNYWTGRVLFGQLLEAVVFLYDHKISHRDMKSDNILLNFNNEEEVPHLVLSDFGCALATGSWKVHYTNDGVDLGGNLALRAPEIRTAHPETNNFIDFSLADLWASATLGYEIFTRCNPFYNRLKSNFYAECDLPPLPRRLPNAIKCLIRDMLSIKPSERPNPHIAANVVNISLFRFGDNLRNFFDDYGFEETLIGRKIGDLKIAASKTLQLLGARMGVAIDNFAMFFAAETILSQCLQPHTISAAELQLRATFLSRLDQEQIWSSLEYFYGNENSCGDC